MAWVRIDEAFYDSRKWTGAPGDSIGLWVAAMAWCNRNDTREDARQGIVPEFTVKGLINVRSIKATLTDLCAREAFHRVDGGYLIHDYEEYQQGERVRAIREKKAAAGRKGAAGRWGDKQEPPDMADAMAPAMANGMADAITEKWPETGPDPVLPTGSTETTDDLQSAAQSSSVIDQAIAIAARAIYEEDPGQARKGVKAFCTGTAKNLRNERIDEINQHLQHTSDPIEIARLLVGSNAGITLAVHALGIAPTTNGAHP